MEGEKAGAAGVLLWVGCIGIITKLLDEYKEIFCVALAADY